VSCPPVRSSPAGEYPDGKQSTAKLTDTELAKLVAKHRKANADASASAIIKVLRAAGHSFSGKRVRVLVNAKPAPKNANAAKVTDKEAALGITR
jgi:hypothetical protein